MCGGGKAQRGHQLFWQLGKVSTVLPTLAWRYGQTSVWVGTALPSYISRCIVMVGLPYPNIKSPELNEKIEYLNSTMVRTLLPITFVSPLPLNLLLSPSTPFSLPFSHPALPSSHPSPDIQMAGYQVRSTMRTSAWKPLTNPLADPSAIQGTMPPLCWWIRGMRGPVWGGSYQSG